jgi:hypothetical protein
VTGVQTCALPIFSLRCAFPIPPIFLCFYICVTSQWFLYCYVIVWLGFFTRNHHFSEFRHTSSISIFLSHAGSFAESWKDGWGIFFLVEAFNLVFIIWFLLSWYLCACVCYQRCMIFRKVGGQRLARRYRLQKYRWFRGYFLPTPSHILLFGNSIDTACCCYLLDHC